MVAETHSDEGTLSAPLNLFSGDCDGTTCKVPVSSSIERRGQSLFDLSDLSCPI